MIESGGKGLLSTSWKYEANIPFEEDLLVYCLRKLSNNGSQRRSKKQLQIVLLQYCTVKSSSKGAASTPYRWIILKKCCFNIVKTNLSPPRYYKKVTKEIKEGEGILGDWTYCLNSIAWEESTDFWNIVQVGDSRWAASIENGKQHTDLGLSPASSAKQIKLPTFTSLFPAPKQK